MNTRYTDVDRLILGRWEEVAAMRLAYDELLDRMGDTIDAACERVGGWLGDQGYQWNHDAKYPVMRAWKAVWEKPRGDALVTLEVRDFAPMGYGRVEADHPYLWAYTDCLERLRMKDADRVRFAKDLKTALGPLATKWDHAEAVEHSEPLGRYCAELSEQQRIELVTHPARLVEFLQAGFTELMELAPAIDSTLVKYREPR